MTKSSLKEYLLFNRNILIGFVGAFLTGAAISQAIAGFTSPLVNSLISIVAELGVFLSIFGVLFYFDNKDKFIDEKGKRRVWKSKVGLNKTSINSFSRRNRI